MRVYNELSSHLRDIFRLSTSDTTAARQAGTLQVAKLLGRQHPKVAATPPKSHCSRDCFRGGAAIMASKKSDSFKVAVRVRPPIQKEVQAKSAQVLVHDNGKS